MNTPKDMIYEINENQRKLERSGKLGCKVTMLETIEQLESKIEEMQKENERLKDQLEYHLRNQ